MKNNMPYRPVNTYGIKFDDLVDEGFFKAVDMHSSISEADIRLQDEAISSHTEERPKIVRPVGQDSWIGFLTGISNKVKRAMMPMLTATMIDLTRLSWENQSTGTLSILTQTGVFGVIHRKGTISPQLIKPREQVHESSLLGPSGFVLGWLEMYGDIVDDDA